MSIVRDARYFLRSLGRQPGFALTVILSLAVGIGANTVMFGVMKTILFDRLAARDPGSLVLLKWQAPDFPAESLSGNVSVEDGSSESTSFSIPAYALFAHSAKTVDSLIAFTSIERLNVSLQGEPTIARGAMVSNNYYDALGVRPALGRLIGSSDRDAVAVLSNAYWRTRFGADRTIAGKSIVLNGKPFTIVGVEPKNFNGTLDVGSAAQVIVPLSAQQLLFGSSDENNPNMWGVQIIGRRKASDAAIGAELSLMLQQQTSVANPTFKDAHRIRVKTLPGARGLNDTREVLQRPVVILACAVSLVLLIACTNVAGLLIARATSRRKEIAVRLSLGASRATLILQLLVESVVLALLGGAAGIALAYWVRPLVPVILPTHGAALDVDVPIDARILGFTILVCVVTGIVFGLVPALRATRVDLESVTRDATTIGSRHRNRASNVLMVIQIAVSIILMVGCALFGRSLATITSGERGFDANNLLLFRLDPTLNGYANARLVQFYDDVVARVRAIPGVRIATPTQYALISGRSAIGTLFIEGRATEPKKREYVYRHVVGEQFLDAMHIPVILGRGFTERDDAGAPKVALISQNLAQHYFPNENPIGRHIGPSKEKAGDIEIVGVVRDARYTSMRDEMPYTMYVPYRQRTDRVGSMTFVVRTTGDPKALADAVRDAVQQIDPNVPLFDVRTQTEQIDDSLRYERAMATLSAFFGLVALALCCIGLYGLMSYIAASRTRETGVRIALGARGRDIASDVLRRALLLVGTGVVIGSAVALALTKFVESMVFGVKPRDPVSVAIAIIAMVVVSLLAAWIPARRASRLDPVTALRAE